MTTDYTVTFKPETLLKLHWSGIEDSAPSILSFQTNRLRYNVLCLDADKTLIYIRNAEYSFNGDDSNLLYLQAVLKNSSLKMCALLEKFV